MVWGIVLGSMSVIIRRLGGIVGVGDGVVGMIDGVVCLIDGMSTGSDAGAISLGVFWWLVERRRVDGTGYGGSRWVDGSEGCGSDVTAW